MWARRRKYLLSGLLSCGQCGGNLTVAGKGARRRYYCANHKEKGKAVCTGMPGLSETDAAESILSGLRTGLMQDAAYEDFRKTFVEKVRAQEHETGEALRRHDVDLSRFDAAPLIASTATKETNYGTETHR
ncbi:recombinase zinc beta ribbon domain-containing protein [Sulfitobacter sp. TCYB15]|uniref:Recombinase zinc beta ribbon domain-containing protein n=1 Tax=Sulfitobacter sp. TCYB15 TaxID=3229275 RepID=A0AAU8C373_9RHOB|nr:recombinase zinc beta ribbon domain-containing protein [Sulfitobacter pontiacus]